MFKISNSERNLSKILIFILTLTLFLCSGGVVCAETALKVFPKYTYSPYTEPPLPNVLFLIDIGAQMAFTTDGVLPLATDGKSVAEHGAMMSDCTYGVGVAPFQTVNEFSDSLEKGIHDKHYITLEDQFNTEEI